MDFKFTTEEQDIVSMLHDFCIKEVQPIAAEIDEQERFPTDTVNKLAEMGMMGLPFPEEYGGAGLSYVTYIAACEELAKYCASTSVTLSAHCSLCCWPISEYGTHEQKVKYLTPLMTGEKIGAFGLTEPSAGTDAAMQKTTAEDKGDHWLINGTKIFITNGGVAETFVIFAMTDKAAGNRGISAFIVEKDFPGFSLGAHEKKMGIRGSSTCELIFDNMIVPKENLLGELNKGFKIAMTTLDGGRIGIAAQALGIAEGAIDECVEYVTQRVQFGQTLSKFQNTQFELADMKTKVEAARLLIYRAAQAKQDHEPYSHLAAQAKLFAAEAASDVTRRTLQLIGGYGYTRDYPFERFMRDAKITEIYEGTSEVQKMVIS
ncbi:MAG: acyl-CoA dehydrogenase, partial [Clostridiales bacterium]|nr:acyl-CoA dehydrogenase [Clostridiales bacterium]